MLQHKHLFLFLYFFILISELWRNIKFFLNKSSFISVQRYCFQFSQYNKKISNQFSSIHTLKKFGLSANFRIWILKFPGCQVFYNRRYYLRGNWECRWYQKSAPMLSSGKWYCTSAYNVYALVGVKFLRSFSITEHNSISISHGWVLSSSEFVRPTRLAAFFYTHLALRL